MSKLLNATLLTAFVAVSVLATAASAEQRKKCAPGSYWDARDQKCIWGNGR